jgi:hypothetical protein
VVGRRILGGLAAAFIAVWGFGSILDFLGGSESVRMADRRSTTLKAGSLAKTGMHRDAAPTVRVGTGVSSTHLSSIGGMGHTSGGHPGAQGETLTAPVNQPTGVAFVTAVIAPLSYELNERFGGWRPNDMFKFTDNVNYFQLGVLEVTRRTTVALAERISRTGTSASFHQNLESAMNWLMIKADQYWFPTPESKYRDSLDQLKRYMEGLKEGKASFYTRSDNLIPLLQVFEDLMGSCEENLVKTHEKTGEKVSHFKADDYFYYAQGVASAMGTILKAVAVDFGPTVGTRRGSEVLQEIIAACHHAQEIQPLFITNASLSGILANHRANLAVPISHARFSLGVLIKTLST